MKRLSLVICICSFIPMAAHAQVVAVASGTTGIVTATMPAVPGFRNWLCGVDVSAAGGTATISPITITGTLSGTCTYQGIAAGQTPFMIRYSPCIPANGINAPISASTTANATATAVNVQMFGYTSN